MGTNISKIDYFNIYSISDFVRPTKNGKKNIYTHVITYNNRRKTQTIVITNEKKEKQFKNNCENYNHMKPLINLNYSKIENITNKTTKTDNNNDIIYKFDIMYTDGTLRKMSLNEYQSATFWKIYSDIQNNK
jgi:hypothetical protein